MSKTTPIATDISGWAPYREIIYRCGHCGQSFHILGDKEKYCHTCGTEVNWANVMTMLPEPFTKQDDYESKQKLLERINTEQAKK